MAMSRQERIAEIISSRAPFLRDIESKQNGLRKQAQAIRAIEELHTQIMKNGPPTMVERLKDIHLAALRQKIERQIEELEKPKTRFSRTTLNIGVIGRARQGKSRLLQSLSGLKSDVIPTGNTEHCTGVRSLICHDHSQQPHGEITFYKEEEFLDNVLTPYYKELNLGASPSSMDSFASRALPPLPSIIPDHPGYVVPGEMYRHLSGYKTNIQQYRSLINEPVLPIKIEQVREYVAQDTVDGKGKFFKHLAVREAKIVCKFDHDDVGQIALVDMPGLGDTGVGAEERLIQALGEHIDTVLFVLMPTPVAGILADVDFGLYDLAYRALEGLPIDRWSFMVLNHTQPPTFGDNHANCIHIKQKIMDGSVGVDDRRIKVVDCIIADCSNPTEAKDIILEKVLTYLAQNMSNLDTFYMSTWQSRSASLQGEIAAELDKAQLALAAGTSQFKDDQKFEELFDELWKQLASALEDLLDDLRKESHRSNKVFENYFKETIARCRAEPGLPTREEIELLRDDVNAYSTAFNMFLDHMRTHLTHQFVDIDEQLKLSMDEVKSSVGQVFLQTGQLHAVVKGATENEFFQEMAAQETLSDHMRETFRVLAQYQLSLRGFFQSRIRDEEHLNNLTPDKSKFGLFTHKPEELLQTLTEVALKGANITNINRETFEQLQKLGRNLKPDGAKPGVSVPKPEEVLQALRDAHKDTVDKLEKKLRFFLAEPSMAALAIVEEFVDQAIRTKHAKTGWRLFYRANMSKVWAADFEKTARWQEYQQQWQVRVKNAIDVNRSDSFASFNLPLRQENPRQGAR